MPVEPVSKGPELATVREVAEFAAREEAESLSEDPREEARRALLQEQHDTQIKKLLEERQALKDENLVLARKVRSTRNALTLRLDALERWFKAITILVAIYVCGNTPGIQKVVEVIIGSMAKGITK